MNIYGRLENKKNFFSNLQELAEKMWFKKRDEKKVEFFYLWHREDFSIRLTLDKSGNDDRWGYKKIETYVGNDLSYEGLNSDIVKIKDFDELQFRTDHTNILTVDKCAFYILVIERMKLAEGLISEDVE